MSIPDRIYRCEATGAAVNSPACGHDIAYVPQSLAEKFAWALHYLDCPPELVTNDQTMAFGFIQELANEFIYDLRLERFVERSKNDN